MSRPKDSNSVPVYGNYHGYYNKRPSTHDPRLAILPRTLFEGCRILDVGCNEGLVTCEIAQSLGARHVVGVDIDDTLIRAAWKHRRSVWSQQAPPQDLGHDEEGQEETSRKRRRTSASETCLTTANSATGPADYFPMACEHMFGPLPIPEPASSPTSESGNRIFPHNVAFRTADWVQDKIPEDADGYDVVLAFSVSKWIHLNRGDKGILAFFRRVHGVLPIGGTFVLEPQEWDTYAKAKRMDTKLRENAASLKLRPGDFNHELQEIGFSPADHLGAVGEGGFRRPVDLYVKLK